ncbi:MAG: hypothetical protein EAS52_15735 [Parapedobacter sp.]|nr:MAG: hypothetical protein EAS52_15735 [Parapedobacter sp.]
MKPIAAILICGILHFCAACQPDELPVYSGEMAVVLEKNWNGAETFSFIQERLITDTAALVPVPIKWLGMADTSESARVDFQVVIESADLQVFGFEGTKHVIPYTFRRKQRTDTLWLNVRRTPLLQDSLFTCTVSIEGAGLNSFLDSESGGYFQRLEILVSDQFQRRDYWSSFESAFGTFSSRKFRVIAAWLNSLFGWPVYDIYLDLDDWVDPEEGLGFSFQAYLDEQAAQGNPILERNGERMVSGLGGTNMSQKGG